MLYSKQLVFSSLKTNKFIEAYNLYDTNSVINQRKYVYNLPGNRTILLIGL